MNELFFRIDPNSKESIKTLKEIQSDYYIDNSGSTSGSILKYEIKSVNDKINANLIPKLCVKWNSTASVVNDVNDIIYSTGGTSPSSFVPFINNPECIFIYTDGAIDIYEMDRFKLSINDKINDIPIIIVFTMINTDTTIQMLQASYYSLNMSIPEIFLSLSNNVLILINDANNERIMMTKGCFDILPSKQLVNETRLNELPLFNINDFVNIEIPTRLPNHLIKLKDFELPIDLNVLYTLHEYNISDPFNNEIQNHDSISISVLNQNFNSSTTSNEIPYEVILKIFTNLCNRIHMSRLNTKRLHTLLVNIQRKIINNIELEFIRNELYMIAISSESGSEKHKNLIEQYNNIKTLNKIRIESFKPLLDQINNFLVLISEYSKDSTLFVYGSNRANRADTINDLELNEIDECAKIECPILMIEGDACILIKYPDDEKFLEQYTSDYAMESPFELGTWLVDLVTVGIFSHELMESNIYSHPMTRERILGYLPLSSNPKVIMRHMSKLFGNKKVLWHFVRAYISMLTYITEKEWSNKSIIIDTLKKLCINYKVSSDLKASDDKISLSLAFSNVINNYSTCLRDRTYNDVIAILKIINLLYPEMIDKQIELKIYAMITFIKEFMVLLDSHKRNENMISYVMEMDDYEHYISNKPGISGLLVYMLWTDIHGLYRGYKLQTAINQALNHPKLGNLINKAFNGEEFDLSIISCAYPEPDGDHFNEERYLQWTKEGVIESHCTFCNLSFVNAADKKMHLKEALGELF